ncbi:MAG TPA: NAD-dependent epimerase/dehydratase family protein [Chloroflexia bacterium]
MEILVTGGTGFLGRHLARGLLERGHEVRLMGRHFAGVSDLLRSGAVAVRADLRDREAVTSACEGVEAVFHAGALSAPWGPSRDFHDINVGGTASVLAGCRAHGVRRIVCVSSPSVVFDGRDHINLREDAPYPRRFASVYSLTKKLGEDLVKAASREGRLETVILRPKAMFGPGDQSLLPRLVEVARRKRLPQIGDGRNLVDLTYVENVVQALILALDSRAAIGKTYTITNGEHVPLWPTVRMVLRRVGLPDDLRSLPLPVALLAARLMEIAGTVRGKEPLLTTYTVGILARTQTYDISAARRDLGYAPAVTVAEGIERTLGDFEQKKAA